MYPTVAGAVTASFSHPEVEATGLPLVMRMSTIARIYSGEITAWDHPDILADQAHDEVRE